MRFAPSGTMPFIGIICATAQLDFALMIYRKVARHPSTLPVRGRDEIPNWEWALSGELDMFPGLRRNIGQGIAQRLHGQGLGESSVPIIPRIYGLSTSDHSREP